MKKIICTFILAALMLNGSYTKGQETESISGSHWNHGLAMSFYIFSDDFFVLPVYQVNKNWLHLEARYNYEDMNTFSVWSGYSFSGGNKFVYNITPMIGGIIGSTNGIAPGLEFTFDYYGFSLYSESEYVFDFDGKEEYFYYSWTDLTYSPLEWMWFGISIQRTKLFETDLDIQRGMELGFGYRWFTLTGYVFNLFWDQPFGVITLTASIPE
jgi:hypothetical protein